ncbi:MAG TPA: YtxH domain-containing protein [Anaerolineae bacterium]|nr:YtxH domain-containing protein [Anaerolineae bacterium]
MNRKMEMALWVFAGVAAGAATAAVVVILFAPQSGAEMRAQIEHRVRQVRDAGQRAAEMKRLELRSELEARQVELA